MAFIQKQQVPISMNGGLQSKNDELQIQPPALLRLINANFDKIGRLNKRFGYDILPTDTTDGDKINRAFAIDSFNGELNLFDNQNLYTYISANGNWANRGNAISLINTNKQIIRTSSAQQLNPDAAYINGIEIYVWEDSRGGVRYSIVDNNTNALPVYDRPITNSFNKPKVVAFNGLFYVFFANNNNLFYRTIDPDNPGVITNQVAVTADGFTDFVYDVHVNPNNNRMYVGFFKDSGSSPDDYVSLFYLDTSNTKHNVGDYDGGNVIEDIDYTSMAVTTDSLNQVWLCYSTGARVKYLVVNSSGSTVLSPTTVENPVQAPTMTAIETPGTPGVIQLTYEIQAEPLPGSPSQQILTNDQKIKSQTITSTGVITLIDIQRSVGLASKAFIHDDKVLVNVVHESPLQSTYFLTDITQAPFSTNVIGKVNAQVGGGLSSNGLIPQVNTVNSSGIYLWCNLVKGKFISENNTNFSLLGVGSTTTDFTSINKFNSAVQTNALLFVGGILQNYDGASVNEQNFHLYPEGIISTYYTTGGALSEGQYQYQVVYAWTDKFGQVHYSTPSPTLTIQSTTATGMVDLLIPTLRLTAKTDVIIKVYRTQVNQPIFQEVTSELVTLDNDPDQDYVLFTDTVADVQMAANSTIYTFGGVIPNTAPPSCSLIAVYQDRVILGGLEEPNLLWFSKNKVNASNSNTLPVEFSAFNTIAITQTGGPITALAVMDDKLIIFKKSSIYLQQGSGPNDTGGDAPFPPVQVISTSIGCDNPNSVIFTKNGIMFQSSKGIWLLDRGLGEPAYLGAGVDNEAKRYRVSSATVDPNDNLVIFTTFEGPAMVYDYFLNQWSTWNNHNAVDSIPFQNKFIFCKSDGRVHQQNRTKFTDGDDFIPMEIVTPWFSMGQMQGYQSIFRAYILGNFKGPHNLNVSVGYDFNSAFSDGYSIPATAISGSNLWGNSNNNSNWGEDEVWGGEYQPYQFQVNMKRQKCTSVRLKIVDVQSPDFNEGFTLSNISLEIGVIGGHNRLPKRNKVGVV